jgi:hypothetical protein
MTLRRKIIFYINIMNILIIHVEIDFNDNHIEKH